MLHALEKHFKVIRNRVQQRNASQAKQLWKAKLCSVRGLNRTLSQAVKSESDKLLRSVRVGETSVLSLEDMARTLSEHWDAYHQKPENDPNSWLQKYDRYLPTPQEPELPPISVARLSTTLKGMKTHTARGADGWGAAELKALPEEALQQLVLVLTAAETHRKWPSTFNQVFTAVLRKGADPGAGDIRPIGVTPIVYRLWASLRFQDLQPWAEEIYPRQLTAYRRAIDLQKINLERAQTIEGALIEGQDLFCLPFDLQKAFDHVPHEALILLLKRLRCPSFMVELLAHRLQHQTQRWKLFGAVSQPRWMARGLIQGCALSCLYFNLLFVLLLLAARENPELCEELQAHADDLFLFGKSLEKARATYALMSDYLKDLAIPLQAKKTQCLGVGQFAVMEIQLGEALVPSQRQIKVLGQDLASYVPAKGTATYVERTRKCKQRIKSIQNLKLPADTRILLLKTMAFPVLNFSPWQAPVAAVKELRAAVVQLVMPSLPRHRAPEIVTTVLQPAHVIDPSCTMLYRLLCHVALDLSQNPQSSL